MHVFLGGLFRWLSMRFFFQADHFPCTYSARAVQEIGLLPPPPPPSSSATATEEEEQYQHAQDAYARVLGLRMLSPTA